MDYSFFCDDEKNPLLTCKKNNLDVSFTLITLKDNEEKSSNIAFTERFTNYIKRFGEN